MAVQTANPLSGDQASQNPDAQQTAVQSSERGGASLSQESSHRGETLHFDRFWTHVSRALARSARVRGGHSDIVQTYRDARWMRADAHHRYIGPGALCRPPSAPLTPTTAQNRPPPTPQNSPPPALSTTASALHIRNTPSNIRTVTPSSPLQSSPLAQFGAGTRPPSFVPDNYQPTYPNLPSLPRLNTNALNNPIPGPGPGSHLHQSGGMNPGHYINAYTSPNPGANPQLSHFANPHTDWASDNINNYGSNFGGSGDGLSGAHGGGDGLGDGVGGGGGGHGSQAGGDSPPAGDDEPAPDERWDDPQDEEDDHQNDHENAQSSLEASFVFVSMHDVDVRRGGQKRSAQETGLTSDAEDAVALHSASRKSRRKRANRCQKSRTVRELSGYSRRAVEAAYPFIQKAVCVEVPWPLTSPSGDPLADDDDFEILIDNAYDDAVKA
ncbi:hypothetical protein B0H14DRAFT_3126166 [Mycena olivaceomarginata]|nr:hypothetical protein B0H14DRAFT_3126166 [Mycena olivaceomarginata]